MFIGFLEKSCLFLWSTKGGKSEREKYSKEKAVEKNFLRPHAVHATQTSTDADFILIRFSAEAFYLRTRTGHLNRFLFVVS